MSLINEMIRAYMVGTGSYLADYKIQNVELLGAEVHVKFDDGYYVETLRIDLLELLAWVHHDKRA